MFKYLKSLAAAGALALAAWAGPASATDYTIGVSIPAATHGWTGGLDFFAQDTIKRMHEAYPNINFVLTTASTVSDQVNQLDDLAARHIDALVVLPMESDPLTEPVKALKAKGIFITVIDRGLSENGIQDLYVAGNNPQYGVTSAQYFLNKFPNGAKIVVLRGIPTAIDNIRIKAFTDTLKGSKIEILGMQYANWNPDKAYEVMQDFLQRFPKIDAVWAGDDDPALGAIAAIRQAGRKNIIVLGGGGMKQFVKDVMDGSNDMVDADVLYHPSLVIPAIELTTMKYATGAPIRGTFQLDSPMITKANAAEYYKSDSPY